MKLVKETAQKARLREWHLGEGAWPVSLVTVTVIATVEDLDIVLVEIEHKYHIRCWISWCKQHNTERLQCIASRDGVIKWLH